MLTILYPRICSFCISLFFLSSVVGYIGTAINDGPGCLMLRCPDPSCGAVVFQDMINALASNEDREKYSRYFIRSYVEDNRKVISYPWVICLCSQNKAKSELSLYLLTCQTFKVILWFHVIEGTMVLSRLPSDQGICGHSPSDLYPMVIQWWRTNKWIHGLSLLYVLVIILHHWI